VRDGLDLKRIMMTVWACAWIPALVGSYFVGLQALGAMQEMGATVAGQLARLGARAAHGYDPGSVWDCVSTA
jgi:Na+-transporting NADH:ubiquinone oxidoreductase subunit B